MPYYASLKNKPADYRRRVAANILSLRAGLQESGIPPRSLHNTLLLGTWNLREFGNSKYGGRLSECYNYIAEVISAFDIVAVQEVRENTAALNEVKHLLGPWWDCMYTLVTRGASGNHERLCILFDTRKVRFKDLTGQVLVEPTKENPTPLQFARAPFLTAFQANWFKFILCTVHMYYGKESQTSEEFKRRVKEIGQVAKAVAKEADSDPGNTYILLGDFNVTSLDDDTGKALTDKGAGFIIPKALFLDSNQSKNKPYDQIAFRPSKNLASFSQIFDEKNHRAGVFDVYKYVFRDEDWEFYSTFAEGRVEPPKTKKDFKEWRSYQVSDHLPKWIELDIDFNQEYLEALRDEPASKTLPPAPQPIPK